MSTTPTFEEYSGVYDLLYRDKDYQAESEYIIGLLNRHSVATGAILEFGSGTGRHGALLAKRGYEVLGIEKSSAMVSEAAKQNGFVCLEGDILDINLGRSFDAVLALFHVASYQVTNEDVGAFFSSAFRHLEPGGIFIFDFWYTPAVYSLKPSIRIKRAENDNMAITRIAEPTTKANENTVVVQYTVFAENKSSRDVRVFSETHAMRHFSLPELRFLAERWNFSVKEFQEFLTGKEPGKDTWGVCIVLQKD